MSRKSAPRFCDDDMRKSKDLKHGSGSERSRRALVFPVAGVFAAEALAPVGDDELTLLRPLPFFADDAANLPEILEFTGRPYVEVVRQGGRIELPQHAGEKAGGSGGAALAQEPCDGGCRRGCDR